MNNIMAMTVINSFGRKLTQSNLLIQTHGQNTVVH